MVSENSIQDAVSLVKKGTFAKAEQLLLELLKEDPDDIQAGTELALLFGRTRRYRQAIELLNRQLANNPDSVRLLTLLGRLEVWFGDTSKGKDYLLKAIALNPKVPLWVYWEAGVKKHEFMKFEEMQMAYTPMPKCGSSSIKAFITLFRTGEVDKFPHRFFSNPYFESGESIASLNTNWYKFAIVRDPVKRFLSYYNKNVMQEKSLLSAFGGARYLAGLDAMPDVNYLVDRLKEFLLMYIDAHHHTLPQSAYLGGDLSVYSELIRFEDLGSFVERLKSERGINEKNIHLMKGNGSEKALFQKVSMHTLNRLIDFYSADYELLSDYYSPDQLIKAFRTALLA